MTWGMGWGSSPGRVRAFVGRVNQQPPKPWVEVEAPDWLSPTQARTLAARLIEAAQLAEQRMAEHEKKKVRRKMPKGDVPEENEP